MAVVEITRCDARGTSIKIRDAKNARAPLGRAVSRQIAFIIFASSSFALPSHHRPNE